MPHLVTKDSNVIISSELPKLYNENFECKKNFSVILILTEKCTLVYQEIISHNSTSD